MYGITTFQLPLMHLIFGGHTSDFAQKQPAWSREQFKLLKIRVINQALFVFANIVILAFLDTIWLFLSEIFFFCSEVKQHAQTILYKAKKNFLPCYILNRKVIFVKQVFREQKS